MELYELKKIANTKYLKFYSVQYKASAIGKYYFVTRRNKKDVQKLDYCDAVKVLPYIKETDEIVFIKNFRYPVNSYVYELPAGLIDKGETEQDAVIRELSEEIGAEVKSIKNFIKTGFTSVGLTDETNSLYFAEVVLSHKQNLDKGEDITIEKVKLDKVDDYIKSHNVDIISSIMARYFVLLKRYNIY